MKFLKNLANRIWDLSTRFRKQIIYLLIIISGGIGGYLLMDTLSGLEIVVQVDKKEILIQGILVASTALIGVTGVFIAAIRFSVAGRFTQRVSSISKLLLHISLVGGLFTVLFAVVWCTNSKDVWIASNIICFSLQLITFMFSIPSLPDTSESID